MKTKIILLLLLIGSFPIFSQPWSTAGNNTLPTDFLGTINGQPINFFTGNTQKASLSVAGDYNLTLGARRYQIAGQNILWHNGIITNIYCGVGAGGNSIGANNTLVGSNAGLNNTGAG